LGIVGEKHQLVNTFQGIFSVIIEAQCIGILGAERHNILVREGGINLQLQNREAKFKKFVWGSYKTSPYSWTG